MEEKKTRRKKKTEEAVAKPVEENKEVREVKPVEYIYHTGDDITKIAKLLTGHSYMVDRLLQVNELSYSTLKDGDTLTWI